MQIDEQLILKLEKLARLRLTDEERIRFISELNKILAMVDKLDELDLNVEPLLHMVAEQNILRDDVIQESIKQEAALQNAPLHDGQFFLVPKMIQSNPDAKNKK